MSDRKLLELAALAAGLSVKWHDSGHYGPTMEIMEDEAGGPPWNPLTDDGDALRLAVKLGIQIHHEGSGEDRAVWAEKVMLWTDGDTLAATRRAIVTAAAARNQTNTKD